MATYTPPNGNAVNFTFLSGYTPPFGDNVDFYFGIIAIVTVDSVSRNIIYDDAVQPGFDSSTIRWHSDLDGYYRIELGGVGVNTGSLIKYGNTLSGFVIRTDISDETIEAANTFSGTGSYRFNIYVKNSDDIWTPYDT